MSYENAVVAVISLITLVLVGSLYQNMKLRENRAGVYATVNLVLHKGTSEALVSRFMGFRIIPRVGDTIRLYPYVFPVTQVDHNHDTTVTIWCDRDVDDLEDAVSKFTEMGWHASNTEPKFRVEIDKETLGRRHGD